MLLTGKYGFCYSKCTSSFLKTTGAFINYLRRSEFTEKFSYSRRNLYLKNYFKDVERNTILFSSRASTAMA